MIIDCFPFYNEMELLEIRCEELRDVVDQFVLVEAAETFSGRPKPLFFDENKEQFAKYPIRQVVIPSFPAEMARPWDREHGTRDIIAQVLRDMKLAPSDVVMISDADEIPSAAAVRETAAKLLGDPAGAYYAFAQELSYYYVNCKCDEGWTGTRMIRWGDIKTSLTTIRYSGGTLVPSAGWHFSYLGGVERIQDKLSASAHTEYDLPQIRDAAHLEACLRTARDLLGRDARMAFVPLDDSFPRYLLDNRERFSALIFQTEPELPKPPEGQRVEATAAIAETLYQEMAAASSDINEHMPTLRRLASEVDHVTEFGTRSGVSTVALLCGKPKRLVAYDRERHRMVDTLEAAATELAVNFDFREQDVLDAEIDETDLLFIDTWHVEEQMRAELERHAHKARLYLVMHDTQTFARFGETAGKRGIWPAIAGYVREHPEWRLLDHFPNNNGLTVFARAGSGQPVAQAPRRGLVIDCFTFHNELELLEIRLNELASVVDVFVIGESRHTFSGLKKPLYFAESAERFAAFPIVHVEIPFREGGAWDREYFARDYLCSVGIPAGSPDDVILLSDVDEIPSAEGVRRACELLTGGETDLVGWDQYFSYYYVNMEAVDQDWHGGVASLRRNFAGGQAMRRRRDDGTRIRDGWHFTYLGGAERIRRKIESFCDIQFNEEKYKDADHLARCMESGGDLFFRGDTYRYRRLDESFPRYLLANRDRFRHLIREEPEAATDKTSRPENDLVRINLGSGPTRYPGFVNLDIAAGPGVDLVGSAARIPVPDGSVAVLFHNAVFEHVFVWEHDLAIREAGRVLARGGVHVGLGIPDFRAVATLYLQDAVGVVGPRFDLFNAYRYTHGQPEQSLPTSTAGGTMDPACPPPPWAAQLHKSLFDPDYLHALLRGLPHVVFRYRFRSEEHAVNLGFIASAGDLDPLAVMEKHVPWVPQTIVDPGSIEIVPESGRRADTLLAVRPRPAAAPPGLKGR